MLASVFIIVISVGLFVYWFRYTCLLILSTKTARDYAQAVAVANQLKFLEARNRLSNELPSADSATNQMLDQVHSLLDRDYRLVTYLLRNATDIHPANEPLEHWLLRFDYRLMCGWYRVTRFVSQPMARRALLERAMILNHMANTMGQRLAHGARA